MEDEDPLLLLLVVALAVGLPLKEWSILYFGGVPISDILDVLTGASLGLVDDEKGGVATDWGSRRGRGNDNERMWWW